MKLVEIKKLADSARIDMSQEEMEGMAKDFEPILAYVSQAQEATKLDSAKQINQSQEDDHFLKNVMREDVATNRRGEFADKLLNEMPNTQDGFLKVKKIL